MIHVFCNKRGTGKTKALVNLANDKVSTSNGHIVYIDDDKRLLLELDRRIRFVNAKDFGINSSENFYGFLCGMISEDYDIDHILIDGLFNIIEDSMGDVAKLFLSIEKLAKDNDIEFYININGEGELPEFITKYAA